MLFLDDAGKAWGNFEDIQHCWGRPALLRKVHEQEVLLVERLLVGVGDECNTEHCLRHAFLAILHALPADLKGHPC